MTTRFFVFQAFVSVSLCLILSSAALAIADLSGWIGENNAPPDPQAEQNNYALIGSPPQTAAGGTFKSRRTRINATIPQSDFEAYLQDQSLIDTTEDIGFDTNDPSRLGFAEDLSMSGTFSFTNPNNADPQFFFGFYNSEPGTINGKHRIGLAVGDETTGMMRVQSQAVNGVTTITNSLTTTGNAPPTAHDPVAHVPAGTYSFDFDYTAANKVFVTSITNGTTTWSRSIDLDAGGAVFDVNDLFDRFGFYQFGSTVAASPPAGNSLTFTFTVSNIDYTGDTDIPIPAVNGDFNSDGTVNAGDYVTWRKNDGTNNALPNDNNLGTPVGPQHYALWRSNFGNPPGSGSLVGGAVPEPASLILIEFALLALSPNRRSRR